MPKQNFSIPLAKLFLLDFGHPMDKSTAENVKNALLNVVSLMSAYSHSHSDDIIVTSIMNANTAIIKNSKSFQRYYNDLYRCLAAEKFDEMPKGKVTIHDFKDSLKKSINIMMDTLKTHLNKLTGDNLTLSRPKDWERDIQLIVLTKKTASLLIDMVKDVISKSKECENLTATKFGLKCEIVQISFEKGIKMILNKNMTHHISCHNTLEDFNALFKNYLFKYESKRKQLEVIISDDLDLTLRCELHDSIMNPALLRMDFQLCNDFMFQVSNRHSFLGLFESVPPLRVLNRIPLSGISPNLLFGMSRRARATEDKSLDFKELQFNRKIFQALCQCLAQAEEGLLTESEIRIETNRIKAYYFLSSDGSSLQLNCIVPEELYLADISNTLSWNFTDQCASLAMRTSLQQIPALKEFSPKMFSSGLYECLKNQMKLPVRKQKSQFFIEKYKKRKNQQALVKPVDDTSTVKNPKELDEQNDIQKVTAENFPKKKCSSRVKPETETIHPALLSPKTTQKYRKFDWATYQLPELYLPHTET